MRLDALARSAQGCGNLWCEGWPDQVFAGKSPGLPVLPGLGDAALREPIYPTRVRRLYLPESTYAAERGIQTRPVRSEVAGQARLGKR